MWVLKTEGSSSGSVSQFTLFAGTHDIGRSGPKPDNPCCDGWISFPGVDKSISRHHASIAVKRLDDPYALEKRQLIFIRDKSKFGVSIDDVDESYREKTAQTSQASQKSLHQIQKDIQVPLMQNCSITVGVNNSRLRLEWEELVVCQSLLSKEQTMSLNNLCADLGIHVVRSWSDRVRLLVMHEIQMTPKLLLALIDHRDIVTPDFMSAIRNRNNLNDPIPDPAAIGPVWERVGDEVLQRQRWRHRITGKFQDEEPGSEEMQSIALFRPHFVEGFPDDYKQYVIANERGKGLRSKMPARGTILAHRVLIFLQADASTIFRQYKQVCERAKAKVECWHPAQVVEQWPIYAAKLLSDNKTTWHVIVSDDFLGAAEEAVTLLRKARVVTTTLDDVWKAIVHADVAYLENHSTQVPALSLGLSPDASALPDTRSLASTMAVQSLQSLQSPQSLQTPSTTPEKREKRRRGDADANAAAAPAGAARASTRGKGVHAGGSGGVGDGVIEMNAACGSPATAGASSPQVRATGASPQVRASKRTRRSAGEDEDEAGGVEKGAVEKAPTAAGAAGVAAQPAAARRNDRKAADCGRGSGCGVEVEDVDVQQVAQDSLATIRRQRDIGKQKGGGRELVDANENEKLEDKNEALQLPPNSPAGALSAGLAGQEHVTHVPETRVRNAHAARPHNVPSEHNLMPCTNGGEGGSSSSAAARSPCRRFEIAGKDDEDGWVTLLSDTTLPSHTPGPRLDRPGLSTGLTAMAERVRNPPAQPLHAGGGGKGSVINFKRFRKKVDTCDVVQKPVITFESWPTKRVVGVASEPAAGGDGARGDGARERQKAVSGGKKSAARRGTDGYSSDEND